ncbi:protein tyrosine phosphatase, non-receptor type 2 S homeolog isoform X1 [Xenopus laevis]|uniref:Tyrosine-protein phosphatase non-receptor type n=1 Tax=Xenopus laevis TaxID=8355 RepID=A0A8J0VLC8_XENLA|nr:protein tyrosine phosphatase, non-receptor type 2 S homeolog isoform X1 [Xenopus laevis]
MEKEFREIDAENGWNSVYGDVRNESPSLPIKIAKNPENKSRNRYRDVNPYDHSRVKLQNMDNDYINASLVVVEEAQRSYILTQGPLPNTCCHFWLMVWQQKSKAIVMLNRIIEKDAVKCAQYWPTPEEEVLFYKETGLCVKLLSEDIKSYYTVRLLQLQDIKTGETRDIFHFHYTTWPDFGVPQSPASFLNFLFKVRESRSLSLQNGPAVVHCSAGIGRSGTFSLVDTCLVLMEKRKDPCSVHIKQVLLDMRKYRMGLIQTPGQLRFSYMAVIEGSKCIMGDSSLQGHWKELSQEDQSPKTDRLSLQRQSAERCNGNRLSDQVKNSLEACIKPQDDGEGKPESSFRRRQEDRKASATQKDHIEELPDYDDDEDDDSIKADRYSSLHRQPGELYNGNRLSTEDQEINENKSESSIRPQDVVDGNAESVIRKRHREDRKANTTQKVQKIMMNEVERKRKRPRLNDT